MCGVKESTEFVTTVLYTKMKSKVFRVWKILQRGVVEWAVDKVVVGGVTSNVARCTAGACGVVVSRRTRRRPALLHVIPDERSTRPIISPTCHKP